MKTTSIAIALALAAIPASAQTTTCYSASGQTYCHTSPTYPPIGEGLLRGQAIASNYAMVNAYREANGLPRCHWGWLGAIIAASNGEPMC